MRCVRVRCRRCGHEGIPAGYCRTLWRRPKPPSEMMNAHARESPPLSTQPSLPTCRQQGRAHHSTPSCAPYAAALTSRCRPSAHLVLLTPMLHARLRPACRRSSASRPSRRVRWSARETSAHAEAPSLRGCAHVPAEVRWEREPPIARAQQTAWCRRQCGGARASSGVTPFLRYARRARCVAPFHSAPSLRQYLRATNAGARAHSRWVYVLACGLRACASTRVENRHRAALLAAGHAAEGRGGGSLADGRHRARGGAVRDRATARGHRACRGPPRGYRR
jgi:hypothetical protein